jgi:ketosteroid isomerase-like protein
VKRAALAALFALAASIARAQAPTETPAPEPTPAPTQTPAAAPALAPAPVAVPAPGAAIDVEAAKRAVRIADLELAKAVADRSLQSFVAQVDDDAIFFGKGVARGKNAVSKAWLPFFTDRNLFLKWYPTQVEISASGDLAYSIGEYERTSKDAAGYPASVTGNYVSIWRKQSDGRWKIVLDIGTPGTPKP